MHSEIEKELVARAQTKDSQAFEELWTDAEKRVRYYLRGIGADLCKVDDILQETALSAWRQIDLFRQQSSFFTWVCVIARNHMLQDFRRYKRYVSLESMSPEEERTTRAEDTVSSRLDQRRLWKAVQEQLTDLERTMFVQHYFLGYQLKELGAMHGIHQNNPRVIVFRARRRVLNHFHPNYYRKDKRENSKLS